MIWLAAVRKFPRGSKVAPNHGWPYGQTRPRVCRRGREGSVLTARRNSKKNGNPIRKFPSCFSFRVASSKGQGVLSDDFDLLLPGCLIGVRLLTRAARIGLASGKPWSTLSREAL